MTGWDQSKQTDTAMTCCCTVIVVVIPRQDLLHSKYLSMAERSVEPNSSEIKYSAPSCMQTC